MKRYILLAMPFLLASCSSLKVSYDYDKQGDFSKYKTYAYSEDAQKLPVGDLNRTRVLNAVDTEMAKKGFTKSENPDVLIDIHVKAEKRTEATATTTGPGGYGYYGRYRYGGGFSTTQVNYNEYIDGTLFINLVDMTTEKIVWQGRATKTIDEDANADKREKNINYAVQQIFLKYPPK